MVDKIKLAIAVLLIAGGIFGFYWYEDVDALYRVLALLGLIGAAIFVAVSSGPGTDAVAYCKSAAQEMRKTVWPTRKETTQTTIIVFVAVFIVGMIILALDSILRWIVNSLLIG